MAFSGAEVFSIALAPHIPVTSQSLVRYL